MKKLAILLALCLVVTAFASCAKKPVNVVDGNATSNDTKTENDTDTENGEDADDTPSHEIEFDDIPAPVKKGIEGRVTENSINVRETPGTKGKSIGTVERNKDLLISEIVGVDDVLWGNMGDGYVCLEYVAFDMDRNGTMVWGTADDTLSAREAPHVFCEVTEKVSSGTRFEIAGFACSGTAVWGLTSYGWVCLNYVTLDRGVEIAKGQNAEELDPFFMAPSYKEVKPKSDESTAPTAEGVIGTWSFAALTGFYGTIYEEYFTAVKGYLTLNEDGTFVCGADECVSILFSQESNVKSWEVETPAAVELGGTYEVTEEGIVLSYTFSKDTVGDEVITDISKVVTLKLTQTEDKLFVKNPKDILYTTEKDVAEITHPVFYLDAGDDLLETVYPGTYY